MGKHIFISYRREDSAGFTRAIANALKETFGAERVFVDVDTLAPGDDFVAKIRQTVGDCAAELVVIGRHWLAAKQDGRRRLDDPSDYVRVEVGAALARGVRVIPILVDGASMPAPADLPDELAPLATRNALSLEHADFDQDMARLISVLRAELGVEATPRTEAGGAASRRMRRGFLVPLVPLVLLLLLAAGWLAWRAWRAVRASSGALPAPVAERPACDETIPWPPASHFFILGWRPVERASTYTVEVDCFGCEQFGRQWHSLGGVPWHVRPGVGLRTPIYSSTILNELREQGGLALRWRVWAVDEDGREGKKSPWCKVTFSGNR
jgi:hypothetical protein